jgi:hypothetical protein
MACSCGVGILPAGNPPGPLDSNQIQIRVNGAVNSLPLVPGVQRFNAKAARCGSAHTACDPCTGQNSHRIGDNVDRPCSEGL